MAKERLYDDVMVEALREDPAFAQAYLHQAFLDMDEDGGQEAFYSRYAMLLKRGRNGDGCPESRCIA